MRRTGFTMIELIFVIVVLGILASVALPKFIGVSEQAHLGKVQALVGTLNRTVGPALWAKSIADPNNNDKGSIKTYQTEFEQQIDINGIEELNGLTLTVSGCGPTPDTDPNAAPGATVPATGKLISGIKIGNDTYDIGCSDGDVNSAPVFKLAKQ